MNVSDLIRTRARDSYTRDDKREIHLLSARGDEYPGIYGSALYQISKPADLDLHQNFIASGDAKKVAREFARRMQRIIKKLQKKPHHYVTDVKAGADNRFALDIGELDNGMYIPAMDNLNTMMRLMLSFKTERATDDIQRIQHILSRTRAHTSLEHDEINDIIREYRIIRWTAREVLAGKKHKNGQTFSLASALIGDSQVKIDAVTYANNRWLEVTNQFYIGYREGHRLHLLNTSYDFTDPVASLQYYEGSIRKEIERLLYSQVHYGPFKACKRMWALARVLYLHGISTQVMSEAIEKLSPIISGGIATLHQIASEMKTIELARDHAIKGDKFIGSTLYGRRDEWRVMISRILELTLMEQQELIERLTHPNLSLIARDIQALIDRLAMKSLVNANYWPVPSEFLPSHRNYRRPTLTGGNLFDDIIDTALPLASIVLPLLL